MSNESLKEKRDKELEILGRMHSLFDEVHSLEYDLHECEIKLDEYVEESKRKTSKKKDREETQLLNKKPQLPSVPPNPDRSVNTPQYPKKMLIPACSLLLMVTFIVVWIVNVILNTSGPLMSFLIAALTIASIVFWFFHARFILSDYNKQKQEYQKWILDSVVADKDEFINQCVDFDKAFEDYVAMVEVEGTQVVKKHESMDKKIDSSIRSKMKEKLKECEALAVQLGAQIPYELRYLLYDAIRYMQENDVGFRTAYYEMLWREEASYRDKYRESDYKDLYSKEMIEIISRVYDSMRT